MLSSSPYRGGGIGALSNTARLSVLRRSCPFARSCPTLGCMHAGCLQLCHRRPPEMCGLRTRSRTHVDPPPVELPSAAGALLSSCGPRGDNVLTLHGRMVCGKHSPNDMYPGIRSSVCLSRRSTAAATCCWFAIDRLLPAPELGLRRGRCQCCGQRRHGRCLVFRFGEANLPLPFPPLLPSRRLRCTSPFSLPCPTLPSFFPSLPLEVRLVNPAWGSGGAL